MGFSAAKGDVSEASLQGRKLHRDLWVLPVQELAAGLNVLLGEIMKLKKAAYGMVEAPVECGGTRLASLEIRLLLLDAD